MTTIDTTKYYSTPDLALATTVTLFYPLEAIDRDPYSQRAYFIFKREESLDQIIEQYWRGEIKVDPKLYFQQLRIIKARLYEEG